MSGEGAAGDRLPGGRMRLSFSCCGERFSEGPCKRDREKEERHCDSERFGGREIKREQAREREGGGGDPAAV